MEIEKREVEKMRVKDKTSEIKRETKLKKDR